MNKQRKKKQQKTNDSSLKYYYEGLFCHEIYTLTNPRYKIALAEFIIYELLLSFTILSILFFPNVTLIAKALLHYNWLYQFTIIVLTYTAIFSFFNLLFRISSLLYEHKNQKVLLKKDMRGVYKIIYYLTVLIDTPLFLIACLLIRFLKKIDLYNIRDLIPIIIGGYSYSIILGMIIITFLLNSFDSLSSYFTYPEEYVDAKTLIYIKTFFVILICKNIPIWIVKVMVKYTKPSRSIERKIYEEYKTLNKYLLFIISIILQALTFDYSTTLFVDAFFYSITALTIIPSKNQ